MLPEELEDQLCVRLAKILLRLSEREQCSYLEILCFIKDSHSGLYILTAFKLYLWFTIKDFTYICQLAAVKSMNSGECYQLLIKAVFFHFTLNYIHVGLSLLENPKITECL